MVIVLQSKNNKKVENKKRLMAKLLCFSQSIVVSVISPETLPLQPLLLQLPKNV
jgi:hypothetical protein